MDNQKIDVRKDVCLILRQFFQQKYLLGKDGTHFRIECKCKFVDAECDSFNSSMIGCSGQLYFLGTAEVGRCR